MNGGDTKRDYTKLCVLKWLSAKMPQMPSSQTLMLSHTGTDASIFAATAAAIRTNAHDRVEDQRAFSR